MRYLLERPLFLTFSWGILLYFALVGLGIWPPIAYVAGIVGIVVSSLWLQKIINHFRR